MGKDLDLLVGNVDETQLFLAPLHRRHVKNSRFFSLNQCCVTFPHWRVVVDRYLYTSICSTVINDVGMSAKIDVSMYIYLSITVINITIYLNLLVSIYLRLLLSISTCFYLSIYVTLI